jgi:hypothetical protein
MLDPQLRVRRALDEQAVQRPDQRVRRQPGQQQGGDLRPPATPREAVDDHSRRQAARKGGQPQRPRPAKARQAEDDGRDSPQRGAAGHADQGGVSQRVAEDRLERGARRG